MCDDVFLILLLFCCAKYAFIILTTIYVVILWNVLSFFFLKHRNVFTEWLQVGLLIVLYVYTPRRPRQNTSDAAKLNGPANKKKKLSKHRSRSPRSVRAMYV